MILNSFLVVSAKLDDDDSVANLAAPKVYKNTYGEQGAWCRPVDSKIQPSIIRNPQGLDRTKIIPINCCHDSVATQGTAKFASSRRLAFNRNGCKKIQFLVLRVILPHVNDIINTNPKRVKRASEISDLNPFRTQVKKGVVV